MTVLLILILLALPPAAALIAGLASGVGGQASLSCNATGSCAMRITGLPVDQIDATCRAAECLTGAAPGEPAGAQPVH